MISGTRKTAAATALLVLVSACQTTGGASGQVVLVKSGLTASVFDTDVEACETYVDTEGPSESEQGAGTAASFLLGGIIGGIAAASAYDNNEKRLMRECMYGKGYRQVALPVEWHGQYSESQGRLPEYEATHELIEQGRVDVLLEYTGGSGKLVSVQPEAEPATATTQPPEPAELEGAAVGAGGFDQETQIWEIIENTTDPKDLDFYLAAYPDGKYVPLVNRKLVALRTVAVSNSDFPYDGTWRIEIDMDRTRLRDRGPDLCDPSTDLPLNVSIREGVLEFLIGSGVPTIVDAEIDSRGRARGRISTAGYWGEVSTFDIRARSTKMEIPFRVAESCSGSFVLRKQSNAVAVLPKSETVEPEKVETTQQVSVTDTVPSGSAAEITYPFDGVWTATVTSSKVVTYSGGPDICYADVKVPERVVVKAGSLNFQVGESNLTVVDGDIRDSGSVAGSLESRGWNGETRRFSAQVSGAKIVIPYIVGNNCEGTVVLIRQTPANDTLEVAAAQQTDSVAQTQRNHPYDGTWRLAVDLTATRQKTWSPDICKFSAERPDRVTISQGSLDFIVGESNPTMVRAEVSEDGQVSGLIDSRGYESKVSSFNFKARSNSMAIPFKIGTSCEGNIFLRRS